MELHLRGVEHSYDGITYVLKNINLSFTRPGIYIVLGPNGSGKTTLLKIIALMIKPIRGSIIIDGSDFWNLNSVERDRLKKDVIYVHDKPLNLRGTVEYNVGLGLRMRGEAKWFDIVYNYMERYQILDIRRVPISKLSTGQMKIITILRALTLNPSIIVLDEPFTYLDRERIKMLLEDIKSLSKDRIIIISTHYMYEELTDMTRVVIELVSGEVKNLRNIG